MLFENALKQVPAEFVCDRMHLKVGLARAKQNFGDLDEALVWAGEVLQEILSLQEPRAEKILAEFHSKLPDDPVAKEFKERFVDYARMRKPRTLFS